ARWESKAGVPVLDGNANERYSQRFINTKELLDCSNAAEAKLCLDNMASFAERMLKLAADQMVSKKPKKSKGRTAVVLEHSKSGPGSSSSPGGAYVSSSPGGAHVSSSVAREPPQKRPREEESLVDLTGPEKQFMALAADEHEAAKGLVTRAELVDKIRILTQDILEGAKYSFENVVAQLKVVNLGVELITEGTEMMRMVENGQIIIPEVYKDMEDEEVEEDDEQDDHQEEGHDDDDDGK
ncbi:hypothetical protein A2U01_0010700, partial [Trifolium medium]|nr:hypothetical protein [Trifolium medium]